MLKSSDETSSRTTKLRLIEINTIAVGLAAAAKLIHAWHKKIVSRTALERLCDVTKHVDNEYSMSFCHFSAT